MVNLYTSSFTVDKCLPVVIIWPMSSSMNVRLDECLRHTREVWVANYGTKDLQKRLTLIVSIPVPW